MRSFKLDSHFVTEEEFERIQDSTDMKVEYMNGEVLYSSNTSLRHNVIISNLLFEIKTFLKNNPCQAYNEQIELIMKKNNELCKFKPDLFIVCKDEFSTQGQSIVGIPKVIFEVASKSNTTHDTIYKFNKYWQFGVLEYNIVYQNGKIAQYILGEGAYELHKMYFKGDTFNSIAYPIIKINLEDIFDSNVDNIEDSKNNDIDEDVINAVKEGKEIGVEEGKNNERIKTIKNMIALDLDKNLIAKSVGIGLDELEEIIKYCND